MKRTVLAILLVAAVAIAAGVSAQPIESFEAESHPAVGPASGMQAERVKEHATDGEYAMKGFFPGDEKDTWPGYSVAVEGNTNEDKALLVDVYNPADKPVRLSCRIDLEGKGKQFTSREMVPGAGVFRVPFALAAEEHPDTKIVGMFVYVSKPREDTTLYFDNLRVE